MRRDRDCAFPPEDGPRQPWIESNPCKICGDIGKLVGKSLREKTGKAGMNDSYRPFIHILHSRDGLTQLELARMTHLTAPTVSVTLQKMEQDGLITRKSDPEDMRQIRVSLTPKGKELHHVVQEIITETENNALSGITSEEQELLKKLLVKIRDNLMTERSGQTNHETD